MTFLYRTFGVPQTLDEFLEKACNTNQEITIKVGRHPAINSFKYDYFIKLETKNAQFITHEVSVGKFNPNVNIKVKEVESDILKHAKNLQNLVEHIGLKSQIFSVSGERIDSITEGYAKVRSKDSYVPCKVSVVYHC